MWDAAEEELHREVTPNLWFQMMRPLIDDMVNPCGPAAKVASLERRVRELSWEGRRVERHVRATAKLVAAQREIAEQRAALAVEKERAETLEALLQEGRKAWSDSGRRAVGRRVPVPARLRPGAAAAGGRGER